MQPLDKRSICFFPAKPSQTYNPNQTYHTPTELPSLCATSHPDAKSKKSHAFQGAVVKNNSSRSCIVCSGLVTV